MPLGWTTVPSWSSSTAAMHADDGLPASLLAEWTHDLFESPHPTFRPDRDVTVVEDTATGRIVSTLFLIPQVWSYAGVPVKVGQPELIATHPDYRRRGLVRAQFDVIHDWSGRPGSCGSSSAASPGTTASSATATRSIYLLVLCSGWARRLRHHRPRSRSGQPPPPTSGSWPPSRPRRRVARRWARARRRWVCLGARPPTEGAWSPLRFW